MGQARLDGSLQAGPPAVTEGTFPASTFSVPIALTPNPKGYLVSDATLSRRINSVPWIALSGLGATDSVTEASTIYLRSDSPLDVRITQSIDDVLVVSTSRLHGTLLREFPSSDPATLVEVKGNATIDFYVQGNR
jgi:hypothetical protein